MAHRSDFLRGDVPEDAKCKCCGSSAADDLTPNTCCDSIICSDCLDKMTAETPNPSCPGCFVPLPRAYTPFFQKRGSVGDYYVSFCEDFTPGNVEVISAHTEVCTRCIQLSRARIHRIAVLSTSSLRDERIKTQEFEQEVEDLRSINRALKAHNDDLCKSITGLAARMQEYNEEINNLQVTIRQLKRENETQVLGIRKREGEFDSGREESKQRIE